MLVITLYFVAQFLIIAFEQALGFSTVRFPPSIAAMVAVFMVCLGLTRLLPQTDSFYRAHLKGPAELLNRHMSIGFIAPVVALIRPPFAGARTVGLIIFLAVVTAVLNSLIVYYLAGQLQTWATRIRKCPDVEQDTTASAAADPRVRGRSAAPLDRNKKALSEASSYVSNSFCVVENSNIESCQQQQSRDAEQDRSLEKQPDFLVTAKANVLHKILVSTISNPLLALCFLFLFCIGIPVRLITGNEIVMDTLALFTFWMAFVTAQTRTKDCRSLENSEKLRILFTTALNPVLWTSLSVVGYIYAKSSANGQSISDVLDSFQANTTFSDLLLHRYSSVTEESPALAPNSTQLDGRGGQGNATSGGVAGSMPSMAAGDIALSVLNAGLVSWGLKLYECRKQLLSRGGVVVVLLSTVVSLGNFVLGPMLARASGLTPASRTISFAARSVTLALAGPAMATMGGDLGLNAVMVVMSGIVYQMAMGAGAGSWLERVISRCWMACRRCVARHRPQFDIWTGVGMQGGAQTSDVVDSSRFVERGRPSRCCDLTTTPGGCFLCATAGQESLGLDHAGQKTRHKAGTSQSASIVATGAMVGVNAAAMGTAYLYEVQSQSAPYAALSMTVFGIMAVIFAVSPLATSVMQRAAA